MFKKLFILQTKGIKKHNVPVFFIRAAIYVVLPPGAALQ